MLSPSVEIETFRASLGCKARPCPEEEKALARPNWPLSLPFHFRSYGLRNPQEGGLHPVQEEGSS